MFDLLSSHSIHVYLSIPPRCKGIIASCIACLSSTVYFTISPHLPCSSPCNCHLWANGWTHKKRRSRRGVKFGCRIEWKFYRLSMPKMKRCLVVHVLIKIHIIECSHNPKTDPTCLDGGEFHPAYFPLKGNAAASHRIIDGLPLWPEAKCGQHVVVCAWP